MWLDALDLLLKRMEEGGVKFGTIVAISGAGHVDQPQGLPSITDLSYVSLATWLCPLDR